MRSATIKKSISPVSIFILLFFIKAISFAFFIIPLWDVPDETGHFAYVRDLAEFNGFPLLGEALIAEDIQTHVHQGEHAGPVRNWIAQHPPLYYLAATPFYWAGQLLTNDNEWLFRAPRIASALSGALTLIIFNKILLHFELGLLVRLSVIAFFASVPMFTLLSSGTNQDTTVALFCSLATLYYIRFAKNKTYFNALWCAVFVSLAAFTKMTALVFSSILMLTVVIELKSVSGWNRWFLRSLILSLVALSLPGFWMARQYINFGNPFATNTDLVNWQLKQPLLTSFSDYIQNFPVFEQFFNHFYGLIGWSGGGFEGLHLLQVQGVPYKYFTICVFILTLFFAVVLFKNVKLIAANKNFTLIVITLVSVFIAYFVNPIEYKDIYLVIRDLIFSLWLFFIVVSILVFFLKKRFFDKLIFYSLIICGFMIIVVFYKVYEVYLLSGQLRAIHGRYFYPLLGFLVVFISYISVSFPRATRFLYPSMAVGFICLEGYVWFNEAIPFFWYRL